MGVLRLCHVYKLRAYVGLQSGNGFMFYAIPVAMNSRML